MDMDAEFLNELRLLREGSSKFYDYSLHSLLLMKLSPQANMFSNTAEASEKLFPVASSTLLFLYSSISHDTSPYHVSIKLYVYLLFT